MGWNDASDRERATVDRKRTKKDMHSILHFVSAFAPTPGSIAKQGTLVYKLYNKFDDSGKCASMLTKLVHGGCFVAGTKVTVSQLPYSEARESSIWSETDWLSSDNYSSSPSPRFREKGSGVEGLGSEKLEVRSVNSFEAELGLLTYPSEATSLLISIEQVPLGARVPTKNPKSWEYDDSLPDPVQADWAKISITMHRNDGGIVDAELIRPRWWIAQHNIVAGKHLPMNIEELQVHGSALVTSIDDCPEIAHGEGSVVTAKFLTREVNTIARVEILGVDGQIEVLEGTTIHPIWSVDRDDWIQLSELQEGERLQAANGIATVVSIAIVSTNVPVYNIEVHGEHVYQVGELGLLVHNAVGCIGGYGELRTLIKGSGLNAHHLLEQRFAGVLGQKSRDMLSIVVNPSQHQIFTNAWRNAIPYGSGTQGATRASVEAAARRIYADFPGILDALGL
jgi:hypothetical protein